MAIKIEPVSKLENKQKTVKKKKKIDDDVMLANCDVNVIFSIHGQSGEIQKPDFEPIFCTTYILINSNILSYKIWKQNQKISNTALTLVLWVKELFLPESAQVFFKKMLTSAKLRDLRL